MALVACNKRCRCLGMRSPGNKFLGHVVENNNLNQTIVNQVVHLVGRASWVMRQTCKPLDHVTLSWCTFCSMSMFEDWFQGHTLLPSFAVVKS